MPTVIFEAVLVLVFLDVAGPFFVGRAVLLVLFFFKAGLLYCTSSAFEIG
jgi:hypothetical protein